MISNGANYTNSTTISLSLSALNASNMSFSNDNATWSAWENVLPAKQWTLTGGDGLKTVYFKARNSAGEAPPVNDTIILDTVPPVVSITSPANGTIFNTQNVTLTGTATDNFGIKGGCFEYISEHGGSSGCGGGLNNLTSIPFTYNVTLQEGNNLIKITYIDVANNSGSASVNLTLDTSVPVVKVSDGQLSDVGLNTTLDITLSEVPTGLSGYNITVSLSNQTVAEIISIEFPAWATLKSNSSLPGNSVWIKAADLSNVVTSGATNVLLAKIKVRGDVPGNTNITIVVNQLDDDNGDSIGYVIVTGSLDVNQPTDTTAPASVTGLTNISYARTYINWTWTDPSDSDFDHVEVYLNGIQKPNVLAGIRYYNATGLTEATTHMISTRTVDALGNVNATWKNHTATTAPLPDTTAPASVTGLTNISYARTYINWTWTDPSDSDFDHVEVYLNGIQKPNVLAGIRYYNATGLTAATTHMISTRTVDALGNVNATWKNHTATTAPLPDTTAPVINSIILDDYTPSTSDPILVTVNATDNMGVTSVIADGVSLTRRTSEIWNGTITAIEGTHSVNVSAKDAAGNVAWNNATSYTATTPIKVNITIDPNSFNPKSQGEITVSIINDTSGFDVSTVDNSTVRFGPNGAKVVKSNLASDKKLILKFDRQATGIICGNTYANLTGKTKNGTNFIGSDIIRTVGCDVTPSRDSGGSSGGSGGGGVITGEPFDNQKSHETKEKNLRAGQPVLYPFTQVEDGIHEISVTGKENEDNVALRIEYLKGLSRNVKDPAPGNVNYYFNLWAGTKKIKSAVIRFSVDNSWLSSNNIAASDLKLLKWDGTKWIQLDTTQTSSDAKHTYYEGGTDSFSSFAITGLNAAGVSSTPPSEATPAQTAQAGTPEATATPGTVPSTNLWLIAVVIIVLVAAAVVYLKGRK